MPQHFASWHTDIKKLASTDPGMDFWTYFFTWRSSAAVPFFTGNQVAFPPQLNGVHALQQQHRLIYFKKLGSLNPCAYFFFLAFNLHGRCASIYIRKMKRLLSFHRYAVVSLCQTKRSFWAISTVIDSVTIQLNSLCPQTAVSPMRFMWDMLTFTIKFNMAITNMKYVLIFSFFFLVFCNWKTWYFPVCSAVS